jgi:SAM-dependent methyltransferase
MKQHTQRTSEWLSSTIDKNYHERQFASPYRSTIHFVNWLEELGYLNNYDQLRILDLGCGQGANLYYMASRFTNIQFTGIDLNKDLVDCGNNFLKEKNIANCHLETGDWYAMGPHLINAFDGCISLQTLSWLPDYAEPLKALSALQSRWICLSSLFYDGPLSCAIEVSDYDENLEVSMKSFYNIYSLPVVQSFLSSLGYSNVASIPFHIDIDLEKPISKGRGTYTENIAEGTRLQISGPLLMPWHFVVAEK